MEPLPITAVGDGFVGKTSMLLCYSTGETPTGYIPTVYENYDASVELDEKKYNVQLWDTDGQAVSDGLPLSHKTTKCFLICYAIDAKITYQSVIEKWNPEIKHYNPKAPVILIGTKSDLRNDPNVQVLKMEEGYKLKDMIQAEQYLECSAVTKEGIEDVFREAVRAIVINTNK